MRVLEVLQEEEKPLRLINPDELDITNPEKEKLKKEIKKANINGYNSDFIKTAKWIRASDSGMLKILVVNGTYVKKREVLGIIQDPFGEFKKKIYAPYDSYVFCINRTPIVNKGDALFHLGLEK